MNSPKTILFVGWGRAGKDASAEYLGTISTLRYAGSTSWAAKELVAQELGVHPMVAWERRHENRLKWKDICDRLRMYDQTLLIRKALRTGDIVAGVRDWRELEAARKEKLFSEIIWVSRPGVPEDPTVTFKPTDCDWVLDNSGTLDDLHSTLRDLARKQGILRTPDIIDTFFPILTPTTDKIRE